MSQDTGERRPVTVVTGGGRGIGAATAVHLARAGKVRPLPPIHRF